MIRGHERKASPTEELHYLPNASLYREQWRYTGPFTRYNRFKGALPGLGTATVAFAVYCTYEYFFMKDEHHGHGKEHGSEEHH